MAYPVFCSSYCTSHEWLRSLICLDFVNLHLRCGLLHVSYGSGVKLILSMNSCAFSILLKAIVCLSFLFSGGQYVQFACVFQ